MKLVIMFQLSNCDGADVHLKAALYDVHKLVWASQEKLNRSKT